MPYDNKLRIIGGRLKGRKLEVLDLEGLRPTTDRARETIFNWLTDKVQGARVLDLFAGSGALGIEALSRGAHEVVLVEKDSDNSKLLQSELASLPDLQGDSIKLIHQDALECLESMKGQKGFDLIFLDPPFASDLLEKSVEKIMSLDLLNENGYIYVEMGKVKKKALFGLQMVREATVGVAHFGLYERSFFI